MKKVIRSVACLVLISFAFVSMEGCYGSFSLTKKWHSWNGSFGNKFVKEIVFIASNIIPIYGICILVDAVLLNTIEFWTGSNPLAMAPGESETQVVTNGEGDSFRITATMNRFDVVQLTGKNAGHESSLVYEPDSATWFMENSVERIALAQQKTPDVVSLLDAEGNTVSEIR